MVRPRAGGRIGPIVTIYDPKKRRRVHEISEIRGEAEVVKMRSEFNDFLRKLYMGWTESVIWEDDDPGGPAPRAAKRGKRKLDSRPCDLLKQSLDPSPTDCAAWNYVAAKRWLRERMLLGKEGNGSPSQIASRKGIQEGG